MNLKYEKLVYDVHPTDADYKIPKIGWYVIFWCYEVEEGSITTVDHWDGNTWASGLPIISYYNERFTTEEKACVFYNNNWYEFQSMCF